MQQEFIHLNQLQNLISLKAEVDKLDIDKLIPVPVYLVKLIDVVKTNRC